MSAGSYNLLAGASGQGGGYNLTRSLRFRSSASAYLNRTPASAGNRKTFTWSGWVKRGSLSTNNVLFSAGLISATYYYSRLYFDSNNNLVFISYPDTASIQATTSAVYRDPSAWYHIVLTVDTTQATNSNGIKIWVNGVQQTLTFASYTQNADTMFNTTSYTDWVGKFVTGGAGDYFDGYLTEVNFIDGQALTPSSFGQTSTTTGVWQPKKYTGTYGTNGFYLPFTDNSALTSGSNAGLGKDFSGNGNYWNTNNISVTAGATYDSMTDVPTLTSATASNFATFNPLMNFSGAFSATPTLSQANLLASGVADTKQYYADSTIQVSSGKWYAEFTPSAVTANASYIGIVTDSYLALYAPTAEYYNNSSWSSYGATYTTGDVIGVAYDADAQTITFYKNGTSQGQKTGITGGNAKFRTSSYNTGASHSWTANFGQRPFAYTPPTGFVALNTFNLPTPTIGATASTQANKYFDVNTWTGTGATNVITNSGSMQPDFVWIKGRSNATYHMLTNAVTGATKYLYSNDTLAEGTWTDQLTSFNSTGFTLGPDTNSTVNFSGRTYVGWQWRASNATAVTNTAGSITSTVSANTSSGFSIVTYTGTGSASTVGHGLGVAPKMVIVKNRVQGTYGNWTVWHTALTGSQYLELNSTSSTLTNSNRWNGTTPTSDVFSVGTDSFGNTNKNGDTYVAYCFSEVAGFSKFGSYTGNGSATFVYTGFKPKFIMLKVTSSTGRWEMFDISRSPSNPSNARLAANENTAEVTDYASPDFLSNGFRLNNANGYTNDSGQTYVYMAFAEFPTKFSLAR